MQLSPADAAYYRYLKQQVDTAQDELFKIDANRRAKINYKLAKDELTQFVSEKRKQGFDI